MYNLHKLTPFPTKINNDENTFAFIESGKVYIMIDTTKQIYVKLNELELDKCKIISWD
jgi:hypothetical protein